MKEAAEPIGRGVIQIFVISRGKVGEGGVDAGRDRVSAHTCI